MDQSVYAIFNIASILQYSLKVINAEAERLFNNTDPDEITIRMGIPTSQYKDRLSAPFQELMRKAVILQSKYNLLCGSGIDYRKILWIIRKEHSLPCGFTVKIEPEVFAEIANFISSSEMPDKAAIIVDIGSATLDFALFSINPYGQKRVLAQYAKIDYYGLDNCVGKTIGGTEKERKNAFITGQKDSRVDSRSYNKVLNEIGTSASEFVKRAMNAISIQFGSLKGKTYYYFIMGGGAIARPIRERIKDAFKNVYDQNRDLFDKRFYLEEGVLPRKTYKNISRNISTRFQVALGLARSDKTYYYAGQTDASVIDKLLDQSSNNTFTSSKARLNLDISYKVFEERNAELYGR